MRFLDRTVLKEKISEALSSVLPVTGIVLLLLITLVPVSAAMLLSFAVGAVLLIVGMGLFNLGAETAMTPMGEYVGSKMTASRKLWVVILVSFFVGLMITVSEPDLQVLATQLPAIPNMALILTVGVGVGLFLVIAMLRVLFRIRLKYLLLFFYAAVFLLACFVPESFLAVSFDSGGVTTGPMTVPFIMALGVGVASISSDDGAGDDNFGMVALCSVGPILAVMILGLIFDVEGQAVPVYTVPDADTSRAIFGVFFRQLPHYMMEMAIALGPIVLFYLLFRLVTGGMGKGGLGKTMMGVLYTYVGLVLFLTGVNVGFMPLGNYLGNALGGSEVRWLIVPLGMLIGYFIVSAEPAVHVLTRQVEEVTSGTIPGKVLKNALSIGVAVSVGIAMLRVLTGVSILWIVLPGYVIALLLSFFVPDIFTSIAFDSGGVASGPMTATFLLPFAMGVCEAVGGGAGDAFGVIALVAMTPLITIQSLGLIYKLRARRKPAAEPQPVMEEEILEREPQTEDEDIIEL
ncbi:MAG: DUF1538 domain-containing protein [Ruminococcaceae bacterium]|nr:DUF1538 domain-containing protein [Oscillospiraceae bacterium]